MIDSHQCITVIYVYSPTFQSWVVRYQFPNGQVESYRIHKPPTHRTKRRMKVCVVCGLTALNVR